MESNGVREKLTAVLEGLTDPENAIQLQEVGAECRNIVNSSPMPEEIVNSFKEAYAELTRQYNEDLGGEGEPYVAVRSSATAEDLPNASFAGQQDTMLNIQGADQMVEAIQKCYASLFTDRALYYRVEQGFDHMKVSLSAVVQMMVFSKSAGVMFTLGVANGDKTKVDIEAAFGLGEFVVGGKVSPHNFMVDKETMTIVEKDISPLRIMLQRNEAGGCVEVPVPEEMQNEPTLTDEQVLQLAEYALSIEKHYGRPMDIEWGLDERTNKLWILQARPETVWSNKAEAKEEASKKTGKHTRKFTENIDENNFDQEFLDNITDEKEIICRGISASMGRVSGQAMVFPKEEIEAQMKVLEGQGDEAGARALEKKWKNNVLSTFRDGSILITEQTDPDWVPVTRKAIAIVTNSGGRTCHSAIVSRELGIPCIVGTGNKGERATDAIKTGDYITVDATSGMIYRGILEDVAISMQAQHTVNETTSGSSSNVTQTIIQESYPVTGTKIMMNLGDPSLADKCAQLPCDGIGLLREEFIWSSYIGKHPLWMIQQGQQKELVATLSDGIRTVCQAMWPRPVILRTSDFKSSEYKSLEGGSEFEPNEPAPLLGWRGCSRYYDPKYKEAFLLELEAIRTVREEFGLINLHIMLPFCRTLEELKKVTRMMEDAGLERGPDLKLYLMAEIPSLLVLADKIDPYIDGWSIGSNDLSMLLFGIDRDSELLASIADERNLAMRRMISKLIKQAHADGVTVGICGNAVNFFPEFTSFLVQQGIDSVSVTPDTVVSARKLVAQVEQRVMMDALTGKGIQKHEDLEW
eukprot:TRINITY_DN1645_c0_g1_i1.p1 TRINITY_DN1645_c0_g1~~TRINITY_DN1645_c0_g1_i1.p1  ORF type:complete len:807 (-),score=321.93 TRINITY_DN1645_c0_g1_i1:19-2439(-)